MIRRSPSRLLGGLLTLFCIAGLSACGSSPPNATSSVATTSPPPGASDTAICQLISKATTAYASQDYTAWRSYMAQVAASADSAQYLPVKRYAEDVKRADSQASTTTTTKARLGKPKGSGVNVNSLFGALGGYVGLQRVCAHLPTAQ